MSGELDFECPLEGSDSELPVTHRQLNGLIRRVGFYHLHPMREQLKTLDDAMTSHLNDCALRQSEIMGGIRVIKWLMSATVFLFSAVSGGVALYLKLKGA